MIFYILQESLVAAKGAVPLTLECAMMISTRNRDEKYGPPFVNSLGTFANKKSTSSP